MTTRTFFISTAILVAASYGAYLEQIAYDPIAEAKEEHMAHEQIARAVASEAMEEQQKCLTDNPGDFCNRDMTYKDHLATARVIDKKIGNAYQLADHTKTRNIYILIAAVAGWVSYSNLRKM